MRFCISTFVLISSLMLFQPLQSQAAVNSSVSQAHPGKGGEFGLGLMLGEPTGLSAKYWTSGSTALAFGLASSWNEYLAILVDHDWHFPAAFGARSPVVPYVGIGAGLFFSTYDRYDPYYPYRYDNRRAMFYGPNPSSIAVGLRIPIGLEFLPRTVPIGIFGEIVPEFLFYPGTYSMVQAALGGRYYF